MAVRISSRGCDSAPDDPGVTDAHRRRGRIARTAGRRRGSGRAIALGLTEQGVKVARLVACPCNADGRSIVGQTIVIDGGYSVLA